MTAARFIPGLILILTLSSMLAGQDVMRNSSKECAICHIRWVEAFDGVNSRTSSSMQTVMERQAGSGDMCLSCHDGSVADSRFKVWSTTHHTTGVKPSPSVRIPTDKFPLDDQGHMTCATCHTAHAVPNSSDISTVVFLRQPNIDSSLCLACHGDHALKNEFQHPLGPTDTPIPQVILDAGGKTADDGRTLICQTCHEPHGARNDWMLVLPPSELCIACHDDKAPETAPPAGAPMHHIGRTYPGFSPPASLLEEKALFGDNGELSCLSCHRLHDASGAWPLLIRPNHNSDLCLDCHQEEASVMNSPHDLRVSAPDVVNAADQTAAQSGPCGACHRIHGWARDVPETNRPHSSGCMECHNDGGPGSRRRPYREAHPVGIAMAQNTSIPLPLDAETNAIGCLTCHDPHTPHPRDESSMLTSESRIPAPRSFLREQGSDLCILCHDQFNDSVLGPHNPEQFSSDILQNLGVHPAFGSCRVCHTTHNAQGPHLSPRTSVSSTDDTSDLCNACHDGNTLVSPEETHHISGTNTEDPDAKQGCATCHNPHGSQSPAAQLWQPREDLCTECHQDKESIRNTIHDPTTAPWAADLTFASKGLCLDCHPIHEARNKGVIRTALGANGNPNTSLCEICHRINAPAKAMPTPHMGKQIRDTDTLQNTSVVVTPSESIPPYETIHCITCHDIHQDTGDPMLLRAPRQNAELCLNCHSQTADVMATQHDLRTSAPDTKNNRNETPAESGPCGTCHLIHPSTGTTDTWAHGNGIMNDFGQSYCTSCHSPGESAEAYVPNPSTHPEVPVYNRFSPGDPEYMPTLDENGRPSSTGQITCLTCHDPHRSVTFGDNSHLFLRKETSQRFCADCHGTETLWRYLYFHQAERKP